MSEIIQSIVPLLEYQEMRSHLFPSRESMRWFVRQNRQELLSAGALLEIAGRTTVIPTVFDGVVLEIGRRAAQG